MYLNHPLVLDFPITLRYGEERDRDFLAAVFKQVWAGLSEIDRNAILARGYGQITVDVVESEVFKASADRGGDIRLGRGKVDHYPHNVVAHIVARELAHKVDDFFHPNPVARLKEPREEVKRRVLAILERWGYPARAKPQHTPADVERIQANSDNSKSGERAGTAPQSSSE